MSNAQELLRLVRANDVQGLKELLNNDASIDINTTEGDDRGRRAIDVAAYWGHAEVIGLLLRHNAEIENGRGHSACYYAIAGSETDVLLQLMTSLGTRINNLPRDEKSEIFINAVKNSWAEVIPRLLEQNDLDFNYRDRSNNTAWTVAAEKGDVGVFRLLVEKGADLSLRDDEGNTVLFLAVKNHDPGVISALFDNLKEMDDPRLLADASRSGNRPMIKHLLDRGASVWEPDEEGFLPIHRAAEQGHVEAIELLMDGMASVGDDWVEKLQQQDSERTRVYTTFAIAAYGNKSVWDSLKDHKAYWKAGDSENSCALHHAGYFGMLDIAERLLDWYDGAVIDTPDANNETALTFAASYGHDSVAKFLLHRGAEPNQRSQWGQTPLIMAASSGRASLVESLLERNADVNQRDDEWDQNALMFAIEGRHVTIVKMLCIAPDQDIDASAGKYHNFTALMFAVLQGKAELLSEILEAKPGLNLEKQDDEGRTALSIAIDYGRLKMVRMLVERSADVYRLDTKSMSPIAHAVDRDENLVGGDDGKFEYLKAVIADSRGQLQAKAIEIALRYSVRRDYKKIISFLLSSPDYLATKDQDERSVLSLAAERGNAYQVKMLLEKGLDLAQKDRNGRTPVSWAAVGTDEGTLRALLAQPDASKHIDGLDGKRMTPLAWAAKMGNLAAVKFLLRHDTQISADEPPVVGEPLNENLPSDHIPSSSRSPAPPKGHIRATQEGVKKPTKALADARDNKDVIRKGRNSPSKVTIDSYDDNDRTPLCYAALNGHKEVVQLLLDSGANPSKPLGINNTNASMVLQSTIKELQDRQHPPEDGAPDISSLEDIQLMLAKFESLDLRFENSSKVDGEFSATLVDILEGQSFTAPSHDMINIDQLLTNVNPRAKDNVAVRWIHLPANNMKWVEVRLQQGAAKYVADRPKH